MCMTYYTVDDLRPGRPGWDVRQFSALAEAIEHYRTLPMDGTRVIGICSRFTPASATSGISGGASLRWRLDFSPFCRIGSVRLPSLTCATLVLQRFLYTN